MRKILPITLIGLLCIATFTTSCTKNKPVEEESVALEGIVFTNISNNSLTLNAGETYAITYKLLPEDFKESITLQWESNDPTIATANNGLIEAISKGETTITAKYNEVEASFTVCVNEVITEVELEGILFTNITGDEVTLSAGETFTVEYQLLPEDVDQTLTIEWISTNESVATVANGTVNAIAAGESTITAKHNEIEASFKVVVEESTPADQMILLQEGFDNGYPEGWEIVDADGDGICWKLGSEILGYPRGISGSEWIMSESYSHKNGVLTPDNHLVSPEFRIPSAGFKLSWYTAGVDKDWYQEHYSVYVREGGSDTEIFSEILSTVEFNYNEVDLSQFAGKTVKIVFRHHDSSDIYHFGLDNIAVANYEIEWVY